MTLSAFVRLFERCSHCGESCVFGPVVVALCVRARGTVAREVGWVHPLRFHGDDVSSLSLQQVPHLLLLSPLCSLLVLLGELLRAAGRGNLLLLIEALALGRANRGRLEQAVARAANRLLPVGVVGRHRPVAILLGRENRKICDSMRAPPPS